MSTVHIRREYGTSEISMYGAVLDGMMVVAHLPANMSNNMKEMAKRTGLCPPTGIA